MFRKLRQWSMVAALALAGCAHVSQRTPAESAPSGTVEIDPSPYQQILVISDVHGMYANLVRLLQSSGTIDANLNWRAGRTLFIVIGDSIDKGPQSLEVIDLWMKLRLQAVVAGGRIVHLLGNHEAEFLANPNNDPKSNLLQELAAAHLTADDIVNPKSVRGSFVTSEPIAAKVGVWLFCHSGRYPKIAWSDLGAQAGQLMAAHQYGDPVFLDNNSILEAKDWEKNPGHLKDSQDRMQAQGFWGVVFGHQPDAFHISGRSAVMAGGRFIKIDNGMAPEAGSNPGSILRFPQPVQLLKPAPATVEVILPTGDHRTLTPESGPI